MSGVGEGKHRVAEKGPDDYGGAGGLRDSPFISAVQRLSPQNSPTYLLELLVPALAPSWPAGFPPMLLVSLPSLP